MRRLLSEHKDMRVVRCGIPNFMESCVSVGDDINNFTGQREGDSGPQRCLPSYEESMASIEKAIVEHRHEANDVDANGMPLQYNPVNGQVIRPPALHRQTLEELAGIGKGGAKGAKLRQQHRRQAASSSDGGVKDGRDSKSPAASSPPVFSSADDDDVPVLSGGLTAPALPQAIAAAKAAAGRAARRATARAAERANARAIARGAGRVGTR